MSGRDGEGVGEIVETAIRRLVTGQKRPEIHVEREQVVDGVVVLQAVETVDRIRPARVGAGRRGRPVDLCLQPARHEVVLGRIRSSHAAGRHGAGPQLPNYRLPGTRSFAGVFDVQHVERQTTAETRLVVTPDTVRVQDLPGVFRVRRSEVGRRRSCKREVGGGGVRTHDYHRDPTRDKEPGQ